MERQEEPTNMELYDWIYSKSDMEIPDGICSRFTMPLDSFLQKQELSHLTRMQKIYLQMDLDNIVNQYRIAHLERMRSLSSYQKKAKRCIRYLNKCESEFSGLRPIDSQANGGFGLDSEFVTFVFETFGNAKRKLCNLSTIAIRRGRTTVDIERGVKEQVTKIFHKFALPVVISSRSNQKGVESSLLGKLLCDIEKAVTGWQPHLVSRRVRKARRKPKVLD